MVSGELGRLDLIGFLRSVEDLPIPTVAAIHGAIEMHLADQQRQGRFNDWLAERLREADIKVSRKYGAWPSDFMSAP